MQSIALQLRSFLHNNEQHLTLIKHHCSWCNQVKVKVKVKEAYSSLQADLPSPLRELTYHKGSHSVTCHPAEVTFPPLPQPKRLVREMVYQYNGHPIWTNHRCEKLAKSFYAVVPGWDSNPRPFDRESDALPQHHDATKVLLHSPIVPIMKRFQQY